VSDAYELCECGSGYYDPERYRSCYGCYLERHAYYVECIFCDRWHSPEYSTCYSCRRRPDRQEAAERLKLQVLWRDGYCCSRCGTHSDLQIDHVRPCALGGRARPWNLQALCAPCNRDKAATFSFRDQRRYDELLAMYFWDLRGFLTDEERVALSLAVDRYRVRCGFRSRRETVKALDCRPDPCDPPYHRLDCSGGADCDAGAAADEEAP
jgi:5-methylcytosine-specific restriction endonuclease McrA